jgi:uncharacterized membrane protein
MHILIKITLLGLLYIFFSAFSMMITGKNEFLSSMKNNNLTFNSFYLYLAIALIFALAARIDYMAINYHLFLDEKYKANAASITAAISALSYIGVLLCNYYFLGEPITLKIFIGFLLITIGCFICLT